MKFVSQAVSQLAHELPLRSPIPFSERMNTIDLGKQSSNFASKLSSRQSFEKMLGGQFVKYLLQLFFDQVWRRKPDDPSAANVLSFRQRDRSELPRPLVNISEEIRMNRLEVFGIEVPLQRVELK